MNSELVSDIVDLGRLEGQYAKVVGYLDEIDIKIKSIKPMTDLFMKTEGAEANRKLFEELAATNAKVIDLNKQIIKLQQDNAEAAKKYAADVIASNNSATQSVLNNAKSLVELKTQMEAVKGAQKQLDQSFKDGKITMEQLTAAKAKLVVTETQLKEAINSTGGVFKQQAKEAQAAEGSVKQLAAQLVQLRAKYDGMTPAARDAIGGQALKEQIIQVDGALKQLEGDTGRFQRNVGNYTGALGILEKALQEVKTNLDNLTNSGKGNDAEARKLTEEYELLEQLVGRQARGFSNLTMEVRNNERQLAMMAAEGLEGTKAFEAMQMATAKAHRELNVFAQRERLLASQAPGLQAMTVATKGLMGAYAVGAGMASMFADGNEKVEKELRQLIAVMTVLQGLEEFHQLLEKQGIIIQIAKNTATSIGIAFQKIWTAVTMETVAATVALRIALIALTGGLLLLVPLTAFAFTKMGESMKSARDKAHELLVEEEELKKLNEKMIDTYAGEKVSLDALVTTLKDETLTRKQKMDVVKELQEKFPGYFDNLKSESDIVSKLADDYERASKGIMMKAIASAGTDILTENMKKQLKGEQQLSHDLIAQAKLRNQDMAAEGDHADKSILDAKELFWKKAKKNRIEAFNEEQKDVDIENKFLKEKIVDANKAIEELGGKLTKGKDKTPKEKKDFDSTAEEIKNEQDLIKVKAEIQKADLERKANIEQQFYEDEKHNYALRLVSLQMYVKDKNKIAEIDERMELDETQVKLARIVDIEKKAADKRTNEEQKLLLEKDVLNAKKLLAETKYTNAIQKNAEDAAKKLKEINQKEEERQIKSITSEKVTANVEEEEAAYAALKVKLDAGRISLAEFNEERERMKEGAELQNLAAEAEGIELLISLRKKYGVDTEDLENKLRDNHKKQEDLALNDDIKRLTTYQDTKKKLKEEDVKLENDAFKAAENLSKQLVSAVYTKQLNAIQKQIDLNTQWKDAEVSRIQSSTLNEQQKQIATDNINAQAQIKQDALEKKKRDIQAKQAVADRDFALLQVAISTAQAVAKIELEVALLTAKAAGNPALAALIPLAAAQIPIAIGIGALEAAAILAKPIPKFATGTNFAPGGLSIVGERGSEMIISPSGNMSLTPDKATLTNLERGSKVITHEKLTQMLEASLMFNGGLGVRGKPDKTGQKLDALAEMTRWQTNELKKAFKNQKQPKVIINNNFRSDWERRNVFE